jgi:hypothetical protein
VLTREKEIGGSGGSLEPPGPLLAHLHTVYMIYSECLPTRLNPLVERTCFSQVRAHAVELVTDGHAEAAATSYEIADQARAIVIAPLYMENPYRSRCFFSSPRSGRGPAEPRHLYEGGVRGQHAAAVRPARRARPHRLRRRRGGGQRDRHRRPSRFWPPGTVPGAQEKCPTVNPDRKYFLGPGGIPGGWDRARRLPT